MWLTKYANDSVNNIVLPLYLYYDDLEVSNPLGSHAGFQKLGAVYTSIASLLPHLACRRQSIFFTCLFHSENRKKVGNKAAFRRVIEEINFLQRTGIRITIDKIVQTAKFKLVLILGVNLGLNSLFGLVECFNDKYWCRICKISTEESWRATVEDASLLRTRENYDQDVKLSYSETGIKETCVFHDIDDFHITENVSVDIMHDLLEGICGYVLRYLLYTFIHVKKYFTLDILNLRIQNFNFNDNERSSKPPIIKMKNTKKKINLKLSASEMLCLFRYLGLIIGDLIPENDKHWKIYILLRQIIDIVTSPRITKEDANFLKNLIQNFLELYIALGERLKPKFHILVHYPNLLLKNGPLVCFWSMTFEAKHEELKQSSTSNSCNINKLVTIATKQTLRMCEIIHSLDCKKTTSFSCPDKNKEFFEKVEIHSTFYKIGTYIVTKIKETEIEFGKIIKIFEINDSVYFHLKLYDEITFDEHSHAYIVCETSNEKLLNYDNLPNAEPCLYVKRGETHFIASRYYL